MNKEEKIKGLNASDEQMRRQKKNSEICKRHFQC